MKRNVIVIVAVLFVVAMGSFLIYKMKLINNGASQVCAVEAKACSDGSVVWRTGQNCEFSACPQVYKKFKAQLSEAEARVIAEKSCVKEGEFLRSGYYNEVARTWWFDAELNTPREGCNPGCVVSDVTKKAEINWRCNGAINQRHSSSELRKLFAEKYPKYADVVEINIEQGIGEAAHGSAMSKIGMPGWVMLAIKNNNGWQIVFDGDNGLDCKKMKADYSFSDAILTSDICN